MANRLDKTFLNAKENSRAALITYIMAYVPDKNSSVRILDSLPGAGADIIELGIPFSDPMADGPIIEKAANIALNNGAKLSGILEMVRDFRSRNKNTPIILMGYYNPIQNYGIEDFCVDATKSGVDGLLIVDLPIEEEADVKLAAEKNKLVWVRLVTPTSSDARIKKLVKSASGFVYYVAVAGVTGTTSATTNSIKEAIIRIKEYTNLPIAVGFGIKNISDVKEVSKHADAVVVGSAIVKETMNTNGDVSSLVSGLAEGLIRSV